MTVLGLVLDVVGKDATLLANGSVKTSMQTETISIGPGESYDCLFTAPATPGTYVLYNRAYATSQNRDQQGIGGMRTEIRVHPRARCPPGARDVSGPSMRLLTRPLPAQAAPPPEAGDLGRSSAHGRLVVLTGGGSSPAAAGDLVPDGVVCTYGSEGQAASTQTFTLTARDGHVTTPDGNTVYMWGFADGKGTFQYPGPNLCVKQGDRVRMILKNTLPAKTSIIFPGQTGVMAAEWQPPLSSTTRARSPR